MLLSAEKCQETPGDCITVQGMVAQLHIEEIKEDACSAAMNKHYAAGVFIWSFTFVRIARRIIIIIVNFENVVSNILFAF